MVRADGLRQTRFNAKEDEGKPKITKQDRNAEGPEGLLHIKKLCV